MVRRMTPSQYNNMVRQLQRKQQQAIDKYNREVRNHNQKVKQSIEKYNREVRAYNARVRADRQRLKNEISRLNRHVSSSKYITFRASVNTVQQAYVRLENAASSGRYDDRYNEVLDLSEREAANNAALLNALEGDADDSEYMAPDRAESPITPILQGISIELSERWQGALYSLSPQNPDAARHFCTSSREIIARILDAKASDNNVLQVMPDCECNQRGTPTRRSKIRYILHEKGMEQDELEEFIEADIENVLELFQTFNKGTHGSAGKFDLPQLHAIRQRVEDGIMFLSRLIH